MKNHYLILPGNPPAAYFYENWIKDLESFCRNSSFEYVPFELMNSNLSDTETIDKLAFKLQEYIEQHTEKKVSLIAHSFGGHLALQALKALPQRIEQVILVFPFLGPPSLRGKSLLSLIHTIRKKEALFKFTRSHFPKLSYFFPEVKKLTPKEITTGLNLAYFEKAFFNEKLLANHLKGTFAKTVFIYNPKDAWCPPKIINALRKRSDSIYSNLAHDFVIDEEQRKLMAKLLAQCINSPVVDGPSQSSSSGIYS